MRGVVPTGLICEPASPASPKSCCVGDQSSVRARLELLNKLRLEGELPLRSIEESAAARLVAVLRCEGVSSRLVMKVLLDARGGESTTSTGKAPGGDLTGDSMMDGRPAAEAEEAAATAAAFLPRRVFAVFGSAILR